MNYQRLSPQQLEKSPPFWKRNFVYRTLRRIPILRQAKSAIDSRIQSAKLQRKVERGYRLVPERELEACYAMAIERLQAMGGGPLGDYLEFGVCHGASLACMHRVTNERGLHEMRLFGFDSFAGLPPEADRPGEGAWRAGAYRSPIAFTKRFLSAAGVDWGRTFLIKGWFKDTLNEQTRAAHRIENASVIMVDCDIYSSARQALEFCAPLIRDHAVLLFDDWHAGGLDKRNMGEAKAFREFLEAHPELCVEERFPSYAKNAEVLLVRRR